MNQNFILTEVILSYNHQCLGKLKLNWNPQKSNYLELEGTIYTILEYHHHYHYQVGGYQLKKISLYVQKVEDSQEKNLVDGRWVLGDINCHFNANSEIIICAVNPQGSCQNCQFFEPKKDNKIHN
ncbi:DUF6464 family protein [Crocosphaera chwakensis]|uniref:Uncharacterized protein n=1 Tax=Crocosphaera chwakensis CCY0110 TaxID=391612 RepID=A3ISE5_9CHRO|nr:DUF6464 family protein [Crocosphaera chwakensis]EAZ90661.1 hypothetical protein CY0110_08301 [Crocosphaera chwakensis CCY0110]